MILFLQPLLYVLIVIITDKYNIDYVVHGDDPCIVDGRDCYEGAVKLGTFKSILLFFLHLMFTIHNLVCTM